MSEELPNRLENIAHDNELDPFERNDVLLAADRLSHLETLVSRLPHVWHRREGEWVRVPKVTMVDLVYFAPEGSNNAFHTLCPTPLSEADPWFATRADALHAQTDPPSQTEGSDA